MGDLHNRRMFFRAAAAASAAWVAADLVDIEEALASAARQVRGRKEPEFSILTPREAEAIVAMTSRILPSVNVRPGAREAGAVYFIDRSPGLENVPMQYDESTHRLFVATRKPSRLVVVNMDTGKEVTSLSTADSVDDMAYDAALHPFSVPGGNLNGAVGAITVIQQKDVDHCEVIANIPSKPVARNARLVPELHKYYINVSKKGPQEAQIQVYDVVPQLEFSPRVAARRVT